MHPEITSDKAATCPICGMALEAVAPRHQEATPGQRGGVVAPHHLLTVEQAMDFPRYASDHTRHRSVAQPYLAPAWRDADDTVSALLYADEAAAVAPEDRAVFHPSAAPEVAVDVTRTADPPAKWDTSLERLVFRIEGDRSSLRPAAAGWVKLRLTPHDVLVVPSSSVLADAAGPYVLAAASRDVFVKRPVDVGKTLKGWTVVASGVAAGESVATNNAFFLDADRRLHAEDPASPPAAP